MDSCCAASRWAENGAAQRVAGLRLDRNYSPGSYEVESPTSPDGPTGPESPTGPYFRHLHRCIDSRGSLVKALPVQGFHPARSLQKEQVAPGSTKCAASGSGSTFNLRGSELPSAEPKCQDNGTIWAGLSFDEVLLAVSSELTKQLELLRAAHLGELRLAGAGEASAQQRRGVLQETTAKLALLPGPVDEPAKSLWEMPGATSLPTSAVDPPGTPSRTASGGQSPNPLAHSDGSRAVVSDQQTLGLSARGLASAAADLTTDIASAAPVGHVPSQLSPSPVSEVSWESSQKQMSMLLAKFSMQDDGTNTEADLAAKAQAMFAEMDEDRDGVVTAAECFACFRAHGINDLSMEDIEKTFQAINKQAYHDPLVESSMPGGGLGLNFAEFKDMVANPYYDLELISDGTAHKLRQLRHSISRCRMSKFIAQVTGTDHSQMPTRKTRVEDVTDSVVGVAVLMNTLVLGIAMDSPWDGWSYVYLLFALIYLAEIIVKVYMWGPSRFFCGTDALWNYADAFFTFSSLGDFLLFVLLRDGDVTHMRNIALLRLVRLIRLTRLIKLMHLKHLKAFKELKLMLRGICFGMPTLGWALALFLFLLYILALMIRILLAPEEGEPPSASPLCNPADEWCLRSQEMIDLHYEELFSDTPRCILTIMRCFTDGCASVDGTPLVPTLFNIYGYPLLITYVCCMFFMTFGLFNLITAILVEGTIEAAKTEKFRHVGFFREEQLLIAQKMKKLVRRTSDFCSGETPTIRRRCQWGLPDISCFNFLRKRENLNEILSDMQEIIITRQVFRNLIWDPEISEVLDDLDISSKNRESFFDVIDEDGNGSVSAEELIEGLFKLRGNVAEKRDAVGILVGLRLIQRDLQDNLKPMIHAIAKLGQHTCDRVSHVESKMSLGSSQASMPSKWGS